MIIFNIKIFNINTINMILNRSFSSIYDKSLILSSITYLVAELNVIHTIIFYHYCTNTTSLV